jgi:uncharacterized protein YacL (UPF0231 family)
VISGWAASIPNFFSRKSKILGVMRDLNCCFVRDMSRRVRWSGIDYLKQVVVRWMNHEWLVEEEVDNVDTANQCVAESADHTEEGELTGVEYANDREKASEVMDDLSRSLLVKAEE